MAQNVGRFYFFPDGYARLITRLERSGVRIKNLRLSQEEMDLLTADTNQNIFLFGYRVLLRNAPSPPDGVEDQPKDHSRKAETNN